MRLSIEPYSGVGPIRFGMTRAQVRRALNLDVELIAKWSNAPPLDVFREPWVMVHYTAEDICEAVELAAPSIPLLLGQELLGRPFDEMRAWFEKQDPGIKVDGSGLTSMKFGVGLYASGALKTPHEPVEGVIAFRQGYYAERLICPF